MPQVCKAEEIGKSFVSEVTGTLAAKERKDRKGRTKAGETTLSFRSCQGARLQPQFAASDSSGD